MTGRAREVALLLASIVAATCAGELILRRWDGYRLDRLRLERVRDNAPVSSPSLDEYVAALTTTAGVDRAWFAQDPEPTGGFLTPDRALRDRYLANPGVELESTYHWNREYVRWGTCEARDLYDLVFGRVRDVFVFAPREPGRFPPYRFLPSAVYPSGLRTNAFGWRGYDIPVDKQPGTLRLAFVGASTTVAPHSDRFAYPDYVGLWLNIWADANGRSVRFEIINAGREGIDSNSIAAIVRQELVPVEPDLVVFYEGANQFWPADYVAFPEGIVPRRPPSTFTAPWPLSRVSAIAARIQQVLVQPVVDGAEPSKPRLAVNWPPEIDERAPDVANARLPVALPNILKNLDTMRSDLAAVGGQVAVASFAWLAHDGLRLDPQAQATIYRYLNSTMWPFSYAHIRRYADFQNRVLAKYAAAHGLPFVDVAGRFPADARLFGDPVHLIPFGIKIMAWIVFQDLVRALVPMLESGRLPAPDRVPTAVRPPFTPAVARVSMHGFGVDCQVPASH